MNEAWDDLCLSVECKKRIENLGQLLNDLCEEIVADDGNLGGGRHIWLETLLKDAADMDTQLGYEELDDRAVDGINFIQETIEKIADINEETMDIVEGVYYKPAEPELDKLEPGV